MDRIKIVTHEDVAGTLAGTRFELLQVLHEQPGLSTVHNSGCSSARRLAAIDLAVAAILVTKSLGEAWTSVPKFDQGRVINVPRAEPIGGRRQRIHGQQWLLAEQVGGAKEDFRQRLEAVGVGHRLQALYERGDDEIQRPLAVVDCGRVVGRDAIRDSGRIGGVGNAWLTSVYMWIARPMLCRLLLQWIMLARLRTFCMAGKSRPIKMAMMAITTNNSISVNAER